MAGTEIETPWGSVRLEKAIPDDAVARVKRVVKVTELSANDEELIYVAREYALTTFEMAMRQRYEEIIKSSSKKMKLSHLITWATAKGLLEESEWRTDLLRRLRNSSLHSRIDYKLGAGLKGSILEIVDTINDLYEDPAERSDRRRDLAEINALLQRLINEGAGLEFNGTRCPIFKAEAFYRRKRNGKRVYYIFCWPTFGLTPDNTGATGEGKPVVFPTERIERSESEIACDTIDSASSRLVIRGIADPVESDKVRKWVKDLYARNPSLRAVIEYDWNVVINSRIRNKEEI